MAKEKKKEVGSFWDYIVSDTKKRVESGKDSFISTVDKIVGQPGATRKALKTKHVLEQADKSGKKAKPKSKKPVYVGVGGMTVSSTKSKNK
jgi:hypothetical protein